MPSDTRQIVTIICESILESPLCDELIELGATGYTVTNARGSGSRGKRGARWETSSNVRIEVICNAEIAARVKAHVHDKYYENYAVVLFETEGVVLRPDKF